MDAFGLARSRRASVRLVERRDWTVHDEKPQQQRASMRWRMQLQEAGTRESEGERGRLGEGGRRGR